MDFSKISKLPRILVDVVILLSYSTKGFKVSSMLDDPVALMDPSENGQVIGLKSFSLSSYALMKKRHLSVVCGIFLSQGLRGKDLPGG